MKHVLFVFICSFLFLYADYVDAAGWGYKNNRIAISADGNNQPDVMHFWTTADPDDWGATPAALAIIAKANKKNQLVHFSYNNFMNSPPHTTAINEMAVGVEGAIQNWGYDSNKFFDVSEDYQKALNDLVRVLQVSTKEDPLFFIHMGPSEFFYRAVQQVIKLGKIESLAHVYVISHSGYNDNHLRRGDPKFDKKPVPASQKHHTLTEAIALSGNRIQYKKIIDQNAKWDANQLWHSEHDWSVWLWMKEHKDETVRWIYQRMKRHPNGVADFSDAGMVYFLLTGDENGSPKKFEQFIGKGINTNSNK
ncbi:hypothetical protein [Paraglaciecola sp. L3A3]|uniref:hypothetical protein n=1 Tax=Paraglaciecola sp. L3A3 TaxID=2686358 RepID=UPI0018EEE498|nr:hypothetical protein [Paraglaciecola sp. L3A3]